MRILGAVTTVVLGVVVLAGMASAVDVPVAGGRLAVGMDTRAVRATLRDPAIAAPFLDPRLAAATLVVNGGAAADQCWAKLVLDPAGWVAIGSDGTRGGYRHRSASGDVRVAVRPGRIVVVVRRAAWPCTAATGAQRAPVAVTLELGATRWCASFGGEVARNAGGRFRARNAPAPAACPSRRVTAATFNVLHGLSCPPATAFCRFADRAALLAQWIAARGCPDVVTLQEILEAQVPTLTAAVAGVCGGSYGVTYERTNGVDDALVFSRVPVVDHAVDRLHGNVRNVLRTRHDHPSGPLDVFTTHLAAGIDGGAQPCGPVCPAECVAAGVATNRECQAVQLARLVDGRPADDGPALVTGDFNASPETALYARLGALGWVDTYLAAGLPPCDPASGVGCTSGRVDDDLGELESTAVNESARIDYVFVVPSGAGACDVEVAGDPDGDGNATGLFADEPNPFAACGSAPLPICWPSDHIGMQAELTCR